MKTHSKALQNAALAAASIVLTLLAMEIGVRVIGETDVDGQFYFLGRRILPHILPIQQMVEAVNYYVERESEAGSTYHPAVGWVYNPDVADVNSQSIRSLQDAYAPEPEPGVIRIALFGDSFTASEEVSIEESWGYLVEQKLNQRGLSVEVLNFGVGGYGIDQAYLRWQNDGSQYHPDFVILGLQPGDMGRNFIVFEDVATRPGGLLYTKPRFILEDGELVLLNSPTIPPEELPDIYRSFDAHPLAQYEGSYGASYDARWWSSSKLLSLTAYMLSDRYGDADEDEVEGSPVTNLSIAIVEAFAEDVAADSSTFVVVHLPDRPHFTVLDEGDTLNYQFMLDWIADEYILVRPETGLLPDRDEWWMPNTHYSPLANEIVAEGVADRLEACIRDGECG